MCIRDRLHRVLGVSFLLSNTVFLKVGHSNFKCITYIAKTKNLYEVMETFTIFKYLVAEYRVTKYILGLCFIQLSLRGSEATWF